jgi:para-nitrobenzyl esterase
MAVTKPAAQADSWLPASVSKTEDCLYLNVHTPAVTGTEKLPVMVWLHGGGYSTGTGNAPYCNLPGLTERGVILVSVNMRLDMLGLLAHPLLTKESGQGVSGNYMFLDMVAALKWIKVNISNFGGDPGNVTIFGNSGGGAKASVLMCSPMTQGLFHRAICESGVAARGFLPGLPINEMEALGEKFFHRLGLDDEKDKLKAARRLPWEKIISAGGPAMGAADAAVDGLFLRDTPGNIFSAGKQHKVPFITIANMGEISIPGGAYFPQFIPGYVNMLANSGKAGVKAYAGIFEHVPPRWKADGASAVHALEIPYVFGDMNYKSDIWQLCSYVTGKKNDPGLDEADRRLSENMMRMWINFARTGDPNVKGLPVWDSYETTKDEYMAFDEPLTVKSGFSKLGGMAKIKS